MTSRITNTLHETAEAVDVPAIDQVAFQQRVRAARRRHLATRSVVAVAASAALVAGIGVVGQWRSSDEPGIANNPGERASFEPMRTLVPFLVDGNLMVLPPDGKPVSAGLKVEEILGKVADGVIVVNDQGLVRRVPLDGNGRPDGQPSPILGDDAVERAVLAKDGSTIGWIDTDGRLHVRRIGETRDLHTEQLTPAAWLVGVAADSWVVLPSEGAKLRLSSADGNVDLGTQSESVELGGGTVAVETYDDGVHLFANPGGDPISTAGVGGDEGALSPDGSTYVAGASAAEVESGMTPDLVLYDVESGKRRVISAPEGLHFTNEVVWTGTNFLVTGGDGKADRIYECSAVALSCRVLYTGEQGHPLALTNS